MVGYHTALNDDPQLTARNWTGKQPLRIALDKNLQLPTTLHLFDDAAETWILNARREKIAGNIQYIQLDFERDIVPQLLQRLAAAKKQSLIVEGGATLLNKFIEVNLWDEARIFTGSNTMGEGIAAPKLANAVQVQSSSIGADELNLYTNANTAYPFVKGWPL